MEHLEGVVAEGADHGDEHNLRLYRAFLRELLRAVVLFKLAHQLVIYRVEELRDLKLREVKVIRAVD